MSRIEIDYAKCVKDRICIRACPYRLFLDSGDGSPILHENAGELCIECGHCLAVCPVGAISLNGVAQESLKERVPSLEPSPESVEQLFTFRRAIRAYKTKPVERELLARLVEITRYAPTAVNGQSVHWTIVDSKDELRRLTGLVAAFMRENNIMPMVAEAWDNGVDLLLRDAPTLAVAHAATTALTPQIDCAVAVATLELAAAANGLGACWAGSIAGAAQASAAVRELLQLPEDHNVYASLMLGYPKFQYNWRPERIPARITWV
ncbi:nitroreductase family protein [Oceanidesulfovibrio marinus]|uniref:Nitroreductase n=1 Tax=Oceanidesulfovibrio marinus TaxID=370038 RepID=A0A6P1ZGA7_9BACT|nr:nitroreductase family protein [Oceanidesulfovibrio marinus]TVM33311.1 nitroreductase [Oceanidesulfovibrio marinus]